MANNLLVSYRSGTAEQDLAKLKRSLESLGACVQLQEGFWYISSSKKALEAKEVLRDSINSDDTLMVIDVTHNDFEMNRMLREQVESRLQRMWS